MCAIVLNAAGALRPEKESLLSEAFTTDLLIVGAGMAGLLAAADLQEKGVNALLVEKSRGVGGRLATRRIGAAFFDHGAQFITARTPRWQALLSRWQAQGIATVWYRGDEDEHPRWRGLPTMTAIPKQLAQRLNVRLETKLTCLQEATTGWRAVFEQGEPVFARAVLLTAPVPQSLAILHAGQVHIEPSLHAQLEAIEYEPCLAVMALLDRASRLPVPGFLRPQHGNIAWLADNHIKGISPVPAITLHATPLFSRTHWEADRQETGKQLLEEAAPWLGAAVTEFQVHGWRYARPLKEATQPCIILREDPPLLLAGDAFGGARVEGAALSGWAAAEWLAGQLK